MNSPITDEAKQAALNEIQSSNCGYRNFGQHVQQLLDTKLEEAEKALETVTKGSFDGMQALANDMVVIRQHRDELAGKVEQYEKALKEIANMPDQSIWMDDRDDAAAAMVSIARRAFLPLKSAGEGQS